MMDENANDRISLQEAISIISLRIGGAIQLSCIVIELRQLVTWT